MDNTKYIQLAGRCELRKILFCASKDMDGAQHEGECESAITDLLARAEAAEKIVDEYAESARAIALWLTAFCDRTLSYPSMISNAARKVSLAYADMEARAEKAERELDKLLSDEESAPFDPFGVIKEE